MTFIPGYADLTIFQGATFEMEFECIVTEESGNMYGLELTDAVPTMEIRSTSKSPVLYSVADIQINTLTNSVIVKIPDIDSELFTFSSALYDIKLTYPNKSIRLVEGRVILSPQITQI